MDGLKGTGQTATSRRRVLCDLTSQTSLFRGQTGLNRPTVVMAEGEVNYAAVVFKSRNPPQAVGKCTLF